ncbi:MAG TPA: DNA polymerase III subunit beta [Syntrophorhabdaceae bacterium]|nr:DNA polymerase III subunit beta [Syntrophorhabdaceae bacterium]
MKTIIIHEGQKNTIQGECKPKEAMEILGLNPKEWKVTARDITDKAATYTIERKDLTLLTGIPIESASSDPEATGGLLEDKPVSTITTGEVSLYREEFEAALQVVCDIVSKKALMPVLGMVRIEVTQETLTISATDLELSYRASIPAIASNATAFLVDAGVLYKEVKALNRTVEDVAITVNADSIQVNGRCTLLASVTDEFPEIKTATGLETTIPNLKTALASVLPAVSTDETRFILTGVFFDMAHGYLVSTDGFRLHRVPIDKTEGIPFVIPRRAAALMHKYGADTLIVNGNQVSSPLVGGIFTTRVIEGAYPDYATVWPDVSGYHKVHFKVQEFLELIPGILPVSDNAAIDMTVNGRIDIKAESVNGSYRWHVPAESTLSGSSKTIRVNCRFLVDAIKAYANKETIDLLFPES